MENTLATCNISGITLGDPPIIRVWTDCGMRTPAAKAWMLSQLRGPNGVAEVTDVTLLDDAILLELSPDVTTQDEARDVFRKAMNRLGHSLACVGFDEYQAMCYSDFDPMAVSSVDTRGPQSSRRG